jgi:hypothetical protein
MAAKANIVVDQATTFSTTLNLTDDAGNPIDLTNYNAEGQIRKWYTSSNVVNFAISISQPKNGIINISLDANTTANMAYGRYVYDIVTITNSGTVTRVVEGILTVTPEVTKVTWLST